MDALVRLPGPPNLGGWAFWDSVVQKPDGLEHEQLKDAARALIHWVRSTCATDHVLLDMTSSIAWLVYIHDTGN